MTHNRPRRDHVSLCEQWPHGTLPDIIILINGNKVKEETITASYEENEPEATDLSGRALVVRVRRLTCSSFLPKTVWRRLALRRQGVTAFGSRDISGVCFPAAADGRRTSEDESQKGLERQNAATAKEWSERYPYSECDFYFVAGHTSNEVPYGTSWEEARKQGLIEDDEPDRSAELLGVIRW